MQMKHCNYRVIFLQRDTRKTGLQKITLICLLSIIFSFLLPVSISTASIDLVETMIEVKQISFPLLFISLIILLYTIVRLLEYRRVIEKKTEALRESEERYALAAQGANDGLWDWNLKTNEIYFSPRWKSMSGYNNDEIGNSSNDWFMLVHPDDVENLKNAIAAHLKEPNTPIENEHRIKNKDGTYLWMLCRGLAVRDKTGKIVRMAGSQTDITSRKKMEEQLIYDAFHDGLTGLPNRALFMDRLSVSFARRKRRKDYHFAVLFMDLDRFKNVNDSFGHLFGNQMLAEVAKRLNNSLRLGDTFSRFGGDEFAIHLDDIANPGFAKIVAERIHSDLTLPFEIDEKQVFITASIGIAVGEGYKRAEDIVRDADIAMYKAKFSGRGCHMIFDEAMRTDVLSYLELETDLRHAINNRNLMLHYQPIIYLETDRIFGFEALLRWNHEKHGFIPSSDFIPMAEETGLIIPIGNWVLQEACQQMSLWQKQFPLNPPLTISVNVSNKQLTHPDFIQQIKDVLERTRLTPQSLKLEITESFLVEDTKITKVLSELKEMDVQIHIDDFGTGYSSLSYIQQFPVSALKIDRSFINKMGLAGEDSEIVKAIVTLAHNLKMDVIAEGVEKGEHLPILKALKCKYVQGYFFSQPVNSEEAGNLISVVSSQ
jgi:diguanylate cyclase (GGDEF)-like protein/PAS domain S-box-containing protein